jgi:hypothetical protein
LISFFVYYRVAERDAIDAEQQVRSMLARLACRTGVAGTLMKRRDDPATWMEVYANVPDAADFERALAAAESEFDVALYAEGSRTRECFIGEVIGARCARS